MARSILPRFGRLLPASFAQIPSNCKAHPCPLRLARNRDGSTNMTAAAYFPNAPHRRSLLTCVPVFSVHRCPIRSYSDACVHQKCGCEATMKRAQPVNTMDRPSCAYGSHCTIVQGSRLHHRELPSEIRSIEKTRPVDCCGRSERVECPEKLQQSQ